jgi:hypothetical protein
VVKPLRPLVATDDRSLFDCDREALNGWLRRRAWANQISFVSRVNVVTDVASGRIAGYVTLSAAQIWRAFLPRPQQRNRPDPVPVTLLGQLAVDRLFEGRGHAASLLVFALRTALVASDTIGSMGRDHAPARRWRAWILFPLGTSGSAVRSTPRHVRTYGRCSEELR